MAHYLEELKRRRVPQFLGLYAGVSWAFIQFVDWLVERYLFSGHWVDVTFIALVAFVPSAALLAYRHGARGRDPWGRAEKLGLPLNAALVLVLLLILFQGEDLGATTETVTVTDEQGQTVERQIPKASHRKRLAIFFVENESGEPALDWLSAGFPLMLAKDLEQDPFVQALTPFSGYEKRFFSRLERAGYPDGRGVPLPLQGRVAAAYRLPFFVDGDFDRAGETYRVRLALYSSAPVRALAERRFAGTEPLALVDEMAVALKEALEVPSGSRRLASDLPAAEHLSESLEVIESYVRAESAMLFHNDVASALDHLDRAIAADPSFAVGQLERSAILGNVGRTGAAREALAGARQHDYKLSERQRLLLKSWETILKGEFDKRIALYEMWVELYPQDVTALLELANAYVWTDGRIRDGIAAYERAYQLEPAQDWILGGLTDLLILEDRAAEAILTARKLAELRPDDSVSFVQLGQVHERLGDLEAARRQFEKAGLLASGLVSPLLQLARLDLKEGRLEAASEKLEEAASIAATAQQESTVLRLEIDMHQLRGELVGAAALYDRLIDLESTFKAPVELMLGTEVLMSEIPIAAGRAEQTAARFEEIAAVVEPPFNVLVDFGRIELALERGQIAAARTLLTRLEEEVDELRREDLRGFLSSFLAEILEHEGDLAGAAATYEETLEIFRRSPISNEYLSRHFTEAELRVALGRALREDGRTREAASVLEEALRFYPSHPGAHLEMGRLGLRQGEPGRARRHLERALAFWSEADAGFEPARLARELLAELTAG